jgi:hypothetical protein
MRHNPLRLETDGHWGVGISPVLGSVLLQTQDRNGNQVKVSLTIEESQEIAHELRLMAVKASQHGVYAV